MDTLLQIAVTIVIVLALACCAVAVWIIKAGPGDADRVVALDLLVAAAVALAIGAALQTGRTVFLDVAIGLALVGFVGTIGWARLLSRSATRVHDEERRR
jgi:multicomponent Na+:H+ antiporter subunit F